MGFFKLLFIQVGHDQFIIFPEQIWHQNYISSVGFLLELDSLANKFVHGTHDIHLLYDMADLGKSELFALKIYFFEE